MEQTRTRFLETQIGKFLPREVITIIRDYDPIWRDYFSKKIVANLNQNVNDFWENKMIEYTQDHRRWDNNYNDTIEKYYRMLWDVLTIPINYGSGGDGTGLFMFD